MEIRKIEKPKGMLLQITKKRVAAYARVSTHDEEQLDSLSAQRSHYETLIKGKSEWIYAVGIPFAYDHFAEGESPEPPFICYLLPDSDNFSADGKAYYKINEVHIELYTDTKDLSVERQLEAVLDEHGIFYDRSEVWIESEKLYEVLYSFEMEA